MRLIIVEHKKDRSQPCEKGEEPPIIEKELCAIDIPEQQDVLSLRKQLAKHELADKHMHWNQVRLEYQASSAKKPIFLEEEKTLESYGLKNNDHLIFKNLGPQLWFRPVYLTEYAGPFVLYPLVYLCYWLYFHNALNLTQKIALVMWMIHFAKRFLETIYVHEFGNLSMPVWNIYKNSIYYWGFGVFCSAWINRPKFPETSKFLLYPALAFMIVMMCCNFRCHLILKHLRIPGSSVVRIPHGFMFEYVSKPNYFFEVLTWVGFSIITGGAPCSILFTLAGAKQINEWAVTGHKKYKEQFPEYPKNRKAWIPFIW